jgi:capsular exopolysaccharide synthesis family protein
VKSAACVLDLRDAVSVPDHVDQEISFVDAPGPELVVHPDADQVFVEQYRRLGAALHHAQHHDSVHSVMIASAVEGEGKTLNATNLALVLSSSFRKRVLLVDGDLRKPSIHEVLQLPNQTGLSEHLTRPTATPPVQALSPALSVITGGQTAVDPVALLVSDGLRRLLATARDEFDWIIVDTPPVLLFPDAGLVASRVDRCVLVVGAATTSSPVAGKAVAAIDASRILGVVLNRAEPSEIAAGYGYGSYGYGGNRTSGARGWWGGGQRRN